MTVERRIDSEEKAPRLDGGGLFTVVVGWRSETAGLGSVAELPKELGPPKRLGFESSYGVRTGHFRGIVNAKTS